MAEEQVASNHLGIGEGAGWSGLVMEKEALEPYARKGRGAVRWWRTGM
jgi:hypothetical protein